MQQLLLIGFGAGLGGMLRFLLVGYLQFKFGRSFPYGTLLVNLLGSFCMGLLVVVIVEHLQHWAAILRPLLLVGVLGGFTTFSAFALDSLVLWHNHKPLLATSYMLISTLGSVSLAWLGARLASTLCG